MSDHWKSLADLLGAPSLTPSKKPSEPIVEKAQPEIAKEQPRHVEPPEAEIDEPPVAPPVETAKPRKRSSWEALANLFNIGTAPQLEESAPPPAPVAVPQPATSPRPAAEATIKQSELSLFKPSSPSEQNPALVDMFGEASSKPHESWGKSRRVVDDLGWDDDEPVAKRTESSVDDSPVKPIRSLDETAEILDDLDSVDGEPVRRSRRRRRRGGRDRGEELRTGDDARPEETTAEFRDSSWGNVVSDDVVDIDEDDASAVGEGDDESSPTDDRRPRRRRRRRGRGRGLEAAEGPATIDDDVDLVNRDLLNSDDEDGPVEDLFEGPSDSESSAEPATDPRRRRRRKRNRGGKMLDEPGQDREVDADDSDDISDDSDDISGASDVDQGDDEEGGHRHRNIPTWEDSLSVLIEANIDNHRRNDNRGGGPRGGGRHRGGRR